MEITAGMKYGRDYLYCERCGEAISPNKATWLEMDDNSVYSIAIIAGNGLPFGRACANKVIANDGMLTKIRRAT